MPIQTLSRTDSDYPPAIAQKMHRPPSQLYISSADWGNILQRPKVAIVGSRNMSHYGQQVTRQLAGDLARQGIVIVSGLALGVDAAAHRGALEAGGLTLAVLPTPLNAVAPRSHRGLAQQIIERGGALLSSYPSGSDIHRGNFLARNEIVAAISNAVIITEAAAKSGSLHTAQFALDMGIPVFAVPGNITQPLSVGTNRLFKNTSAAPLIHIDDVLAALDLPLPAKRLLPQGGTPQEQAILNLLSQGTHDGSELLQNSGLSPEHFSQALTMLEINGQVHALGGNHWSLA